ncbi:replication restart helicase PriA [Anaerovibrio sp.]|uniref:replication restart helicase PriA n=1 Tax=Anaerovibrio sp. TaxID=1872532 RepID=UPI003F139E0E
MLIADVYINIPVKSIAQAFSYRVPESLAKLSAGWRVLVPFGGRDIEGFTVCVYPADRRQEHGCSYPVEKLKYIKAAVDEEPWFSPLMIKAARWLADFYLCSAGEMMRLFMPGKSGLKIQLQYEAVPDMEDNMLLMVDVYRQAYEALLSAGPEREGELRRQLAAEGNQDAAAQLDNILAGLLKHGVVRRVYGASHRATESRESYLSVEKPITKDDIEGLDKRKKAQRRLLSWLYARQQPDEPLAISLKELQQEGFSRAVVSGLTDSGFGAVRQRRVLRDSYRDFAATGRVRELTAEQQRAVAAVDEQLASGGHRTFLLYGVTGSGKTQVYIEAARRTREMGRSVVVLVPEIALTGQVVQEFKGYFGGDIVVMHSRLSISERNDAILRVRTGQAGVIIGARSALFTPADNIGLIIMDEEQDSSYKQDESPRYHARVVAQKLAELHGGVLLLGSATPSLETYYHARRGDYGLLCMPQRIGSRQLPQVISADMRQELKLGRRSVISLPLQELIADTLARHEQMILMLNRRGFATFVMCRSCGEAIKCPQCTMPLVFHRDGRLLCHHCDIQAPVPDVCPKCGSPYIKYFGSGTEKLEKELAELVPQARIIRMDRDTTTGKFAHTEILDKFRRKEFDILLGTQMVAKGHDIPSVTAVGILSADSTLNMPDFRAAERVFMLITQTAGRAGRGDVPGRVVVQCYNPGHFAVRTGIEQDYEAFFREEMKLRKALFNPPFSRIIKLVFQHEEEEKARQMAEKLKEDFQREFRDNPLQQAAGPAPAMMAWLRGVYRFSLLIRTGDIESVLCFLRRQGVESDMRVMVDIDPLTTS